MEMKGGRRLDKRICPQCGANVIDDFWEEIDILENGNILLDTFEAFVYEKRCSYCERQTFH